MRMRQAWRGLLLAGGAYLAKRWWDKKQAANGMSRGMSSASNEPAAGGAGYASGGGMGSDPAAGTPPSL